jgi:hypothetical protein
MQVDIDIYQQLWSSVQNMLYSGDFGIAQVSNDSVISILFSLISIFSAQTGYKDKIFNYMPLHIKKMASYRNLSYDTVSCVPQDVLSS